MSQAPARAWWAEVEHLREAAERRQAGASPEREVSPHYSALRQLDQRVTRDRALEDRATGPAPAQRRTVKIRGQAVPIASTRPLHIASDEELASVVVDGPWVRPQPPTASRQRPRPRAIDRVGPRPDRLALYAFIAGLLLVVIALATAH
jgi:hypothetical protein